MAIEKNIEKSNSKGSGSHVARNLFLGAVFSGTLLLSPKPANAYDLQGKSAANDKQEQTLKGKDQLLSEKAPTFVKDTASTYLTEGFHFVYQPYLHEQTTLRLISGPDANAYNSADKQVESRPSMVVKEMHLPKPFDSLVVGDTFRFNSKNWTVDSASVGTNGGSLKIHSGAETIVLQHGSSFNMVPAGDSAYNTKVGIGQADTSGKVPAFNPKSQVISLYDTLSFSGKNFKPGDKFKLPNAIGGDEFTFNFVDSASTGLNFAQAGKMNFDIGGGNILSLNAIKLPIKKMGNLPVDSAYLSPSTNSILYQETGSSTFTVQNNADGMVMAYSDPACVSPLGFYFNLNKQAIVATENVRPSVQKWSMLPINMRADSSYFFDKVFYTGLKDTKPVDRGSAAMTERGSIVAVDSNNAAYNYSHKIARCEWSVAAKDSIVTPPSSVQDNQTAQGNGLLISPNPASGVVKIQLNGQNGAKAKSVSIYNSLGQEVFRQSQNSLSAQELEFNAQGLPNGEYFVTASYYGGAVGTKQLIIQK